MADDEEMGGSFLWHLAESQNTTSLADVVHQLCAKPPEANENDNHNNNNNDDDLLEEQASISNTTISTSNNNNNDNVDRHTDSNMATTTTISSARFNLLSTMVGGGCLSLPYAFLKSGLIVAPIILLIVALFMESGSWALVRSQRMLSFLMPALSSTTTTTTPRRHQGSSSSSVSSNTQSDSDRVGFQQQNQNYGCMPSLAGAATGRAWMETMTRTVVSVFCFMTLIGYAVLMRDLLQGLFVAHQEERQEEHQELEEHQQQREQQQQQQQQLVMAKVTLAAGLVLVVTLSSLRSMTSLHRLGALSMIAVGVLTICLAICATTAAWSDGGAWSNGGAPLSLLLWPQSGWDVFNVLPIYIYCYVCQINVLKVHSEFQVRPTRPQLHQWLRSTTVVATIIYIAIGLAGASIFPKADQVSCNILLDLLNKHPQRDTVVVEVARYCMVVTLVLAVPLLVMPLRDILISLIVVSSSASSSESTALVGGDQSACEANGSFQGQPRLQSQTTDLDVCLENDNHSIMGQLQEPLLTAPSTPDTILNEIDDEIEAGASENVSECSTIEHGNESRDDSSNTSPTTSSASLRFLVALGLVGSAIGVAHVTPDIGIVWDVLGSSLSILIAIIIPTVSILSLLSYKARMDEGMEESTLASSGHRQRYKWIALLLIAMPTMILSTANAIHETFF